jgi:acetyl/propionyl-CoA carboxylase alpha subunit/acetyl-CoA carboxylase carboxyltransferase component
MDEIKKLEKDAYIGIVNRGEAALRFLRAVKEYNNLHATRLKTVVFFTEKEEYAPFVKMADKAVAFSELSLYGKSGKIPYMDHELLLEALRVSKCEAVWAGWGFVSEDAEFAEKIEKEGLVFLGPSSRAMALLGDKITAKELAERAEVPILPWSRKSVSSFDEAAVIAEEIGYPVIVKAANAGGGRGIRFVRKPEELETQFKSAREETLRITGNDVVFIEGLVEQGRHLEVQVLADQHGNVNTFGVRDCSVQRKNQKIIEETPAPGFSREFLNAMEEAAARLISAAGYVGAGTVEYLYDMKRKRYFFMEVNTRLQVEHPITETLYGIDLVKGQIQVAMGEKVEWSDRSPSGAVVEVRLNAEDPERDFSPAPGRVELFKPPAGPGIRVDSGIEQYSEIPSDFDSMIAKIIAHGRNRQEALSRLKRALGELRIRIKNGTTNRAFLLHLLDNPDIQNGGVSTGFVEDLVRREVKKPDEKKLELALLAGSIEMYFREFRQDFMNFQEQIARIGRPRHLPDSHGYQVHLSAFGNSYYFLVKSAGNHRYHVTSGDSEILCRYVETEQESILFVKGERYNIIMSPRGDALQCEVDGYPFLLEMDSGGYVKAQSPAIVLGISVKENQEVKKGDVLLILEAMKMEMLIEAPADGVVKEVCVQEGAQIAAGQSLVLLESGEESEEKQNSGTAPIEFTSAVKDERGHWELCRQNLSALFLGYDTDKEPLAAYREIIDYALRDPQEKASLIPYFISLFKVYAEVERLFTNKELQSDLLARPMSYQEMLSHYFRRTGDREKGLPEQFLADLHAAADNYPIGGLTAREHIDYALFNMFKSHGNIVAKQELLKQMFFTLEEIEVPESSHRELSIALDRIIELCEKASQSVADAAMHLRYQVIDREKLEKVRQKNYQAVRELAGKISEEEEAADILNAVIDAGPYIIPELIKTALSGNFNSTKRALQLLALRFNRDRDIARSRHILEGEIPIFHVYGAGLHGYSSITAVVREEDFLRGLPLKEWIRACGGGFEAGEAEVTVLVRKDTDRDPAALFEAVSSMETTELKWFTVGIFSEGQTVIYRRYLPAEKWEEFRLARGFSPLQYRELKVYRLQNFDLEVIYRNEGVFLVEATARENPGDIRLIAFADVSETEPETDSKAAFQRLRMFETLYMEAVLAMRSAQAKYRYRLQWNRIVIHNRNLLSIKFRELRRYGRRLMYAARDLGLEKLTVYSRRKRWSEQKVRELQLDFVVITEDQFSLRSRSPSEDALQPFDEYVSRAVRARQRGMVYPYEFIKMLTHTGISRSETIPRGEFIEYDIEINKQTGDQMPVSVAGRAPGLNESNIVFGILTNFDAAFPVPLRRVLILSDPTTDLGSLAEPESRRVNAALDLAESEKIPVEWVPLSSGAKINMDSGTENLDWTATTLRRIVEFTQSGGEINIVVAGVNVGAQSYWNAEATMLMHTRGLLIMTEDASILLTGKKALDFSGSVSGESNLDIGGAEKIMAPNGQAQLKVPNLAEAYKLLFQHYRYTYVRAGDFFPPRVESPDPADRDISKEPYSDFLGQGFTEIGEIFSLEKNPERKKPFDIRQVMKALIDRDAGYLERWRSMLDSDTGIVWETRIGGFGVGMMGIESRNLPRIGEVPFDGPESWSGGTLFPMSSKKIARGINAFSGHLPLVILANLSGFDGSPESLRKLQLEYGAEIGRAIVNFRGPIAFVVVARYHGGAYVVFSKSLNPHLRAAALEGSYASVIGGAPAAAVVFPKNVLKDTYSDSRILSAQQQLKEGRMSQKEFDDLFSRVKNEKQTELGQKFDRIHSVERAKKVGSIDDIISVSQLRPYIISVIEKGMAAFSPSVKP